LAFKTLVAIKKIVERSAKKKGDGMKTIIPLEHLGLHVTPKINADNIAREGIRGKPVWYFKPKISGNELDEDNRGFLAITTRTYH